jgi:hypothetical protein
VGFLAVDQVTNEGEVVGDVAGDEAAPLADGVAELLKVGQTCSTDVVGAYRVEATLS